MTLVVRENLITFTLGGCMSDTKLTIHEVMEAMPEQWRHRWCGGSACACLGGANCSGGLMRHGFTKQDWEDWKAETGFVDPVKEEPDFSKLIEYLQSTQENSHTLEDPPEYRIDGACATPIVRETV